MESNHQPNIPPPPTHHDSVAPTQFYPIQAPQPSPHLEGAANWSQEQENKRIVDALKTKLARTKRKLARQRSLLNKSISSASSAGSNSNPVEERIRSVVRTDRSHLLFDFFTPDNKRLRLLLKKVLRKSDVGALGRIVLPKKETEENLPYLHEKEGIQLVMRDVYSTQEWTVKFKYWINNKSRMYVLENAGEFVKENGIESGDCLNLFEDESSKLYYIFQKAIRSEETQPTNQIVEEDRFYYQTYQAREEEDASLALLIEQLKHREHMEEEETRNILGLTSCPPTNNAQTYELSNNNHP